MSSRRQGSTFAYCDLCGEPERIHGPDQLRVHTAVAEQRKRIQELEQQLERVIAHLNVHAGVERGRHPGNASEALSRSALMLTTGKEPTR